VVHRPPAQSSRCEEVRVDPRLHPGAKVERLASDVPSDAFASPPRRQPAPQRSA
jgi:hypothetical protein